MGKIKIKNPSRILSFIKENYEKAELKIIHRPFPKVVCVGCVCWGTRGLGVCVAHSVAVSQTMWESSS